MTPFERGLDTERLYFELGATLVALEGATLAYMPCLAAAPAGAVVHRVDPDAISAPRWLAKAEQALGEVGALYARIYLDNDNPIAGEHLLAAGYRRREELLFIHCISPANDAIAIRPVASPADWAIKLEFQRRLEGSPDGHPHNPSEWVAIERAKAVEGMDWFFAEQNGAVVGALGVFWARDILRFKNIVVHRDHRRRGVARAMLGAVAALGRDRGISEQCLFAVKGEEGEQLYRAEGMRVAGAQVEWSKRLGGAIR